MKIINIVVAVMVFLILLFGVFAVELVMVFQVQNMNKIGVVFVDGVFIFDVLEVKLVEKAAAVGVSGYSIIFVINNNKLSGIVVIYK